jgi:hypothetical protein
LAASTAVLLRWNANACPTRRITVNIERVYQRNVAGAELARDLADHFRRQGFDAQVFETTNNRTVMQARKDSLWRQLLGVAYAITAVLASEEGPPDR